MTYAELRRTAEAYYRLCDEAEALGVPVALDNPDAPQTVAALRRAVAEAA